MLSERVNAFQAMCPSQVKAQTRLTHGTRVGVLGKARLIVQVLKVLTAEAGEVAWFGAIWDEF